MKKVLIAIGSVLVLAGCNSQATYVVAKIDNNTPPHCIVVEHERTSGLFGQHSHVDDHAVYCRQP